MSKIDLSKAKVGDKFRDRLGRLHELIYILKRDNSPQCLLVNEQKDNFCSYWLDGSYYKHDESKLDLVEQVFDRGDLLDNNISVEERWQAIVEMAKSEYEKAKEFGVVIQNLPHIVEQQKEEKQELQRRQEVVELAEKLFTRGTMKDWFYELLQNNKIKTTYVEYIFVYAKEFVNAKDKYLKEGKL